MRNELELINTVILLLQEIIIIYINDIVVR
jgi:hypothetical protein